MIVLDTNVIIAYLNGDARAVDAIDNARKQSERFCISAVTATELLAFPKLSLRDRNLLKAWIKDNVFVASVDAGLSIEAGDLCGTHALKTADGIIAATALRMHVPLMTRDKDFLHVTGLQVIS